MYRRKQGDPVSLFLLKLFGRNIYVYGGGDDFKRRVKLFLNCQREVSSISNALINKEPREKRQSIAYAREMDSRNKSRRWRTTTTPLRHLQREQSSLSSFSKRWLLLKKNNHVFFSMENHLSTNYSTRLYSLERRLYSKRCQRFTSTNRWQWHRDPTKQTFYLLNIYFLFQDIVDDVWEAINAVWIKNKPSHIKTRRRPGVYNETRW